MSEPAWSERAPGDGALIAAGNPSAPGGFRRSLDGRVSWAAEALVHGSLLHWLAAANALFAALLGLSILPPILMWLGFPGPATALYSAFHTICHQLPYRSYFVFGQQAVYSAADLQALVGPEGVFDFIGSAQLGYKLGLCERDVAIYGAMLLGGVLFTRIRGRLRPPPLLLLGLLILPIALDGTSQILIGRESTWQLRTATGVLFGLAAVWMIYPQMDRGAKRRMRHYGLA